MPAIDILIGAHDVSVFIEFMKLNINTLHQDEGKRDFTVSYPHENNSQMGHRTLRMRVHPPIRLRT